MDENLFGIVKFAIPISLEQAIQLLTVIVQVLAIAASGYYVGWQIKSAKKTEVQFKLHEQRKKQYQDLINLIEEALISVKSQTKFEINQKKWTDVQMGMSLYASREVLKSYLNLLKSSKEENDKFKINKQIGDLILLMRKEVGFEDINVTSRDVLSTFVNDIDDPKYDDYFR